MHGPSLILRFIFFSCVVMASGCGGKKAPDVWSVAPACGQPNRVWVQFATGDDRDALKQSSAETTSNYSVAGLSVTGASLYSDDQAVLLTLSGNLTQATEINVTASNIKDTANRNQSPSSVSLPVVYHVTQQGAMGLYFRNKNLSGSIESTAVDATIDFDVGSGSLGSIGSNNFGIRWYTFVEIFQAGEYGLRAIADDGVRVWFQDQDTDPVIDEWHDGSATYTASDTFTATNADVGKRKPIVMEYYENKGDAKTRLQWDTPSSGFVTIPSNRLYTCIPAPAALSLSSYAITAPATASTCGTASITVTATDSSGAMLTSYTGTVTLTTSSNHGDWSISSGAGTLNNGTADDGSATYVFSTSDNGTATFALANVHADTLSVVATEDGSAVSNTSTPIVFSDNAFVISASDAFGSDVIAGRDHGIVVQFIRRPPSGEQCAIDTGYTGNKNLKLWRSTTPANAAGALAPTLRYGAAAVSLPAAVPASNNASAVVFNAGQASFTLVTTDAGQYALNARDDSSGYAVDNTGTPIAVNGVSSTLTIRPFGVSLTATNSAGGANPGASSAADDAFSKAGTPFNMIVRGVLYQSADDLDPVDGLPDGYTDDNSATLASLSDNTSVPSFGNEGTGAATVSLSSTLISPVGGTAPSLAGATSATSFTAGSTTLQPRFDEVGIIEVKATSSNYLGSGRTLYGASGPIGRFTPASFSVTESQQPSLAHGHGTCQYTYQGETVSYAQAPTPTITAKNARGDTTLNYGGDYWKLPVPAAATLSESLTNLPADSTASISRDVAGVTYGWNNTHTDLDGAATLTLSGDTYTFTKHPTQGPLVGDVPFTPKIALTLPVTALTDTDGICHATGASCDVYIINGDDDTGFAGTELRYARLHLAPATGTLVTPALMPATVEHWASIGANQSFLTATEENSACTGTSLTLANLQLDNYQGALSDGEVTPQFSGIGAGGTGVISLAVDANADPASISGAVRVSLSVPVSLQYNQTGSGLSNPTALATFGIYGGRHPIFNIQEGFR